MLTIFTIPKSFQGHINIIQRNAIQSWLHLSSSCEVILCGNDRGVAEVADEFNISHISDIECNQYGTPLLDSAFEQVQRMAQNRLICYVNTDIIFVPGLIKAVRQIPFPEFLILGQRWDVDISAPINFSISDWDQRILAQVRAEGKLHRSIGSDYFIFPNGKMDKLPEFAVGRPGWDNWFIYNARKHQIPVIDATEVVKAIHQNHDYNHIPHGDKKPKYYGPEADYNLGLVGGGEFSFNTNDATHRLTANSLDLALDDKYVQQRFRRQKVLDDRSGLIARLRKKIFRGLYWNYESFPKAVLRWLARSYLK